MSESEAIIKKNNSILNLQDVSFAVMRAPVVPEPNNPNITRPFFIIIDAQTGEITRCSSDADIHNKAYLNITCELETNMFTGEMIQLTVPFFPDEVTESIKTIVNKNIEIFNEALEQQAG